MRSGSENFNTVADRRHGVYYKVRLVVDGVAKADVINDFSYTQMCCDEKGLEIGTAYSSYCSFTITRPSFAVTSSTFIVQVGARLDDGTFDYINLGKFKASITSRDGDIYKYECYDRFTYELNGSLGSVTGVGITNNKTAMQKLIGSGYDIGEIDTVAFGKTYADALKSFETKREAIGFIATISGGYNAYCDGDGTIKFRYLDDKRESYELTESHIYMGNNKLIGGELSVNMAKKSGKPSQYPYMYPYSNENATGVEIKTIANVNNPFCLQDILVKSYTHYGGITYRAVNLKCVGDPRIEAGDIIKVTSNSATFYTIVMSVTHTCDGGMTSTIKSYTYDGNAVQDVDNSSEMLIEDSTDGTYTVKAVFVSGKQIWNNESINATIKAQIFSNGAEITYQALKDSGFDVLWKIGESSTSIGETVSVVGDASLTVSVNIIKVAPEREES